MDLNLLFTMVCVMSAVLTFYNGFKPIIYYGMSYVCCTNFL